MSSQPTKKFQDASTDCAICLGSLQEGKVIELTCGHKWHLQCIQDQLKHAQPSPAQRLLFTGCQCAKCGAVCDHPQLQHLTRQTDALRERVNALIADQLQVDVPDLWKRVATDDETGKKALMEHGQRTYAFYLCSCCEEPYFGGTIECADAAAEPPQPGERRLCAACSPQTVCPTPLLHRGHLVWKCRYCCQPSQFVCYGSVHFCQACHQRNAERLRQLQRVSHGRRPVPSQAVPASLEPIPCPGGEACPFPKPAGQDTHHNNGPSADCEQVYECVCCASAAVPEEEAPGSENLLQNPNGAQGLQGWTRLDRLPPRLSWQVERCDIPPDEHIATNFVSAFHWCVMMQQVPLHRFVRNPAAVRVQVSARYMGRTDCPSVFCLEALLLGQAAAGGRAVVLQRQKTPILPAPADSWERATLTLEPTPNAREVAIVLHGKDSRFWQGTYGSKVTACSVRILGTPQELQEQWIAAADPHAAAGTGVLRKRLWHILCVCLMMILAVVFFVVSTQAQPRRDGIKEL